MNNSNDLIPTTYDRRLISKFLDGTKNTLASFYLRSAYNYKGVYSLTLLLRADGSSNAQPTSRWFYSPVLSGKWDLKKDKLQNIRTISDLNIRVSYGRLGITDINDRNATGPLYSADIGWTNEPRIPSFLTVSTLTRPYTYGYTGYNIPWAYNEQVNVGVDFGLFKNRLRGSLDLYSTTTKNQLLGIPTASEYGYSQVYYNGMNINNSGVDLTLAADIIAPTKGFKWTSSLNLNLNHNKLKSLPLALKNVVIDNRKLEVGKSVDQYWLLQNNGIYYSDAEVPVNPKTNKPLTYKGIPLKAGDPKWEDTNGDYNVDDNDKVLKGHILPVVSGGFINTFRMGSFDLTADLYFNIGRDILNQNMSNRFNFINQESSNTINSAKEITFWQKEGDYSLYPKYNPWSLVNPYRVEQDLFLENASFVKLRNLSFGCNLTSVMNKRIKKGRFKSMYVYISASNVFTITPYTGQDPEIVNFTGYDTGYGLPIPRTFTTGLKMDF